MNIRQVTCLMFILFASNGVFANEQIITLDGLQKELDNLKQKAEKHTGTVLAESSVKLTTEYLQNNWPPTARPPTINYLVRVLKIIKVETGPMVHKPEITYSFPDPGLGFLSVEKKEIKRFKYYLTIEKGHFRYTFVPLDNDIPNKAKEGIKE